MTEDTYIATKDLPWLPVGEAWDRLFASRPLCLPRWGAALPRGIL